MNPGAAARCLSGAAAAYRVLDRALRDFLRATLPEFRIPRRSSHSRAAAADRHGRSIAPPCRRRVERAACAARPLRRPAHRRPSVPSPPSSPRPWRLDEVGVSDDFFELGDHSLHAAQAAALISCGLAYRLPLRALFVHRTVGRPLAAHLDGLNWGEPAPAQIPAQSRTSACRCRLRSSRCG